MARFLTLFVFTIALINPLTVEAQVGLRGECPAGSQRCGPSNCCRGAQRCSWDGFCIPPGGNYCGGGRSCPAGQECINGGLFCAPHGSKRCGNGKICPPGTTCGRNGSCTPRGERPGLDVPEQLDGTGGCLPGGGCAKPGWFLCEETGSQCRPGFKCSEHRGCVPVNAVDCGNARWCKPGEICTADGGCAPE